MSSRAMSLLKLVPVTTLNRRLIAPDRPERSMTALCHAFPWSLDMLQIVVHELPVPASRYNVPIVEPYMWYQNSICSFEYELKSIVGPWIIAVLPP